MVCINIYIYYIRFVCMVNVGIYPSPMDAMGEGKLMVGNEGELRIPNKGPIFLMRVCRVDGTRRTAIEVSTVLLATRFPTPKSHIYIYIRKHAVSPTRVVALESISLRLVADLMFKLMGRIVNMGPSKKNTISSWTSRSTFMFKFP